MSASPDDMHGTDLLAHEIKEEAGRLVRHPVEEVKRLEHVAEERIVQQRCSFSSWPSPLSWP